MICRWLMLEWMMRYCLLVLALGVSASVVINFCLKFSYFFHLTLALHGWFSFIEWFVFLFGVVNFTL